MRVALVVSAFYPAVGGVEEHVLQLASRISAMGHQVSVLTNQLQPEHSPEQNLNGVRVLRFSQLSSAGNYRYSAKQLSYLRAHRDQFDLVHAHSYHTLVPVNAALSGIRPLVFTPHYHGTGHTRFRALLHRPYRRVGGRAFAASNAVICVSHAEAQRVRADFPEVADRIVVVPNGTACPSPSPDALAQSAVRDSDIVTVGRLEDYKGVDVLIAALNQLDARHRLFVIGAGPAGQRLAELARDHAVAERVVFTGRIPDEGLQSALLKAGVVASMSAHEAFGLCVADGLAAGAAVVASDIPAHREVIELGGGDAGRVVDPRDQAAVVGALRAALAAGRPDQGSGAPATLPGWDEVAERTLQVYRNVLSASPAMVTR